MEAQIRRLAAAAESLELQARELRAEIRELADSLSSQAGDSPRKASAGPDGARLVALSMALDGKPREETAQHLRDSFGLEDVEEMLADVYARAGA